MRLHFGLVLDFVPLYDHRSDVPVLGQVVVVSSYDKQT